MIEIPEAQVLSKQLITVLEDKKTIAVEANQSPHKFAWFYGAPEDYKNKLINKNFKDVKVHAGFIAINFDKTTLLLSDGVNIRYLEPQAKEPKKHQLLLTFDDRSMLVLSIQMYGGLWCFSDDEIFENDYFSTAIQKPSPLSHAFDYAYYLKLIDSIDQDKLSVKAFLATEQRIPGLGNGVLQDILFNAKIHPKRKIADLSDLELKALYDSIKDTLNTMIEQGGRDTEKDIFGNPGGYKTKMSRNTYKKSCPNCGGTINKASYMGGTIYTCDHCQRL